MKVKCLFTNPETSRAELCWVELTEEQLGRSTDLGEFVKAPGAEAEPHHPDKPTLLKVAAGSHNIIFPSPDGNSELILTLRAGTEQDSVLFLDFAPDRPPAGQGSLPHGYAGHRSIAGQRGATLRRWSWETLDVPTP